MPVIPTFNLTINPYTSLYTEQVADADIEVGTTAREGRTELVLDYNKGEGVFSRDFETAFSWPISSGTVLYTYQPNFIELPENTYDRYSDWIDLGGARLVQGYSIMADSFNGGKAFQLQNGDDLSVHSFVEMADGGIAFNKQTRKTFSCVPFVAHTIRRISSDRAPWRVWSEEPISIPYPESAGNWTTEMTAANGVGWQHLREMNVEYNSKSAITLSFTVDSENGSYAPQPVTIPSSSGTQTKLKIELTANKWKLISFSVTSTLPFALFVDGVEAKIRSWGSDNPYRIERPFGGKTVMQAEA